MIKVLITGFMHSGTTMLMQLLNTHPQVCKIEFEEAYIEFDKSKEWVLMMLKKSCIGKKGKVCGEKIPWGTRENDLHAERSIAFTKKWIRYFNKDSRILHIMRHPMDISLSRYPLNLPNNMIYDKEMLHYCLNSVPEYISFSNEIDCCRTVIYEEILERAHDISKNIFDFIEIDSDKKIVDKILEIVKPRPERAYAFLDKGIKCDFNYDHIWEKAKNRL